MKKSNKYSGRKLRTPDLNKERNYTQIPNAFILNPDIGNSELRLLQYIMMSKDGWTIKTDDCIKYLCKTKQAVYPLFDKLITLGILKITDETIEVIIPDEMKKYKLGYLRGQENLTTEVKKTSPSNSEKTMRDGQENLTSMVKKTLPSSKENLTTEVKKTYKKPLDNVDIEEVTNPIILYNTTRVLPVPAKSGNTEQSHSNNNTKDNTGSGLDLECDELQSQASPSVLAPALHTPKEEKEKEGKESSLPIGEEFQSPSIEEQSPIQNSLPILLEESEGLRQAFQNSSSGIDDFRLVSDSYIANVYLSIKLEKKISTWSKKLESHNYNPKHYGVYVYAGRSALEADIDTELKTQLISQSKMAEKELYELIYGFKL